MIKRFSTYLLILYSRAKLLYHFTWNMKLIYKIKVPFNNNLPLFFRIQYQQQTMLHIFHVDLNAYIILVAIGFPTAQQITDAYYSHIVQK